MGSFSLLTLYWQHIIKRQGFDYKLSGDTPTVLGSTQWIVSKGYYLEGWYQEGIPGPRNTCCYTVQWPKLNPDQEGCFKRGTRQWLSHIRRIESCTYRGQCSTFSSISLCCTLSLILRAFLLLLVFRCTNSCLLGFLPALSDWMLFAILGLRAWGFCVRNWLCFARGWRLEVPRICECKWFANFTALSSWRFGTIILLPL